MKARRTSIQSVLLIASLVLGGAACGGDAENESLTVEAGEIVPATGLELLGPRRSAEMLNALSPVIIDVRTPEEYASGHIEGARLIDISSADFASQIGALDRATTYFVYCRSGNRSSVATSMMLELGFTSMFELDGGILSWNSEGLPLVG